MKILSVAYMDLDKENFVGVKKKIESQIKSFENLKNKVDLLYIKDNKIRIIGENECDIKVKKGYSNYRKSVKQEILNMAENYDLIYIRFPRYYRLLYIQFNQKT